MISKYSKFQEGKLKIEANYNPKVVPCKLIRFTIGKESVEVDRSHLYNLLVLFADDEEMDKCLNIKSKKMIMVRKMVKVFTKDGVKAGGELVFPINIPIDAEFYDDYLKTNKDGMMKEEEARDLLNKK